MAGDARTLRAQLRRLGARRQRGLDMSKEALSDIAELLPDALEAGLSKTEIHELTGVSRPTIDGLLRDGE